MLQQSGTITLSQIGSEAGDSNPISIGDLYNGGSYFPSTTTSPVNGALPSSGNALRFSNFYGCIKRTTRVSGLSTRINNVIWTGSQFVAVGDAGVIMYSSNGSSWTNANTTNTLNVQGIAWSGSEYIITTIDTASSNYFKIYRSTNLSSWTLVYNPGYSISYNSCYSITYGANKFCAIDAGGTVYYSTNSTGTAWNFSSSSVGSDPWTTNKNKLAWNGSIFSVSHGAFPYTSTDGITFTQRAWGSGVVSSSANTSFSLGWTGNVFVSAAKVNSTGDSYLVKSSDGITWSLLENVTNPSYATGIANSGSSYTLTIKDNKIRRSSQTVTSFTDLTAYGNNPYAMAASSSIAVLLAYNGSTYDISTVSL